MDNIRQHIMDMIELGFPVRFGIVQPVVDPPEIIGFGINVEAIHPTDAPGQVVRITAVLATDPFDPGEKSLSSTASRTPHNRSMSPPLALRQCPTSSGRSSVRRAESG
jgi:hypothetical protein